MVVRRRPLFRRRVCLVVALVGLAERLVEQLDQYFQFGQAD